MWKRAPEDVDGEMKKKIEIRTHFYRAFDTKIRGKKRNKQNDSLKWLGKLCSFRGTIQNPDSVLPPEEELKEIVSALKHNKETWDIGIMTRM